jgi:hypothetical protein
MQAKRGRTKAVDIPNTATKEGDNAISEIKRNTVANGISVVRNNSGYITVYVLMDDGTIMYKGEQEDEWHTMRVDFPKEK